MNDHESAVLSDSLHRLADRTAPQVDVVGLVRDARSRHGRRRRARVALLVAATATAAVAVGVPVGIAALDSSGSGQVAGPVEPTTPELPAPFGQDDDSPQQRLESAISAIADALDEPDYTGSTVSLTAPEGTFPCPPDTGEMQAALGGIHLVHRAGLLPGDTGACSWSVPGSATGDAEDYFAVEIGFTPGWTAEDVSAGPPLGDGCSRRHVIPAATGGNLLLDACPHGSGTWWQLFALDSSGSGVWTFLASAGEDQRIDGPAALLAVVELADRTW